MDEPLTVLCIAQGTTKPIYDMPLEVAVTKIFDSCISEVAFQAYREDVEDALVMYAKRNAISDPELAIYKVKVVENAKGNKIKYSDVNLIEYP